MRYVVINLTLSLTKLIYLFHLTAAAIHNWKWVKITRNFTVNYRNSISETWVDFV